jgi:hypothetical protein
LRCAKSTETTVIGAPLPLNEAQLRAQLAVGGAVQASQLALFATLHDDRRPPFERTASGRYLQLGLFENKVVKKGEPPISIPIQMT